MMMRRTVVSGIAMMLAAASLTLSAYAQSSTAFTYQGFLKDNNNPANAQYDLQFTLYDAPTGGNRIGNSVVFDDLQITNGLFTVEIDFGINPFSSGQRRWIEIGIRPFNSSGSFVILDPRIELTPVPYAIYAQKAKDAENAQNAQNAVNAQNAQNAVNAQNAENAQNAVNAQNAETADVANSVAPGSVTSAGLANDANSLSKVSGGALSITPDGFLKNNSQHVYFYARLNVPLFVVVATTSDPPGWYPIKLPLDDAVVANFGGGLYDEDTGVYTVPTSGFYHISFTSRGTNHCVTYSPTIELVKGDDERLAFATARRAAPPWWMPDNGSVTISGVYYLQQGDQISFRQEHVAGTCDYGTSAWDIYLTIYLLSAADAPSN